MVQKPFFKGFYDFHLRPGRFHIKRPFVFLEPGPACYCVLMTEKEKHRMKYLEQQNDMLIRLVERLKKKTSHAELAQKLAAIEAENNKLYALVDKLKEKETLQDAQLAAYMSILKEKRNKKNFHPPSLDVH